MALAKGADCIHTVRVCEWTLICVVHHHPCMLLVHEEHLLLSRCLWQGRPSTADSLKVGGGISCAVSFLSGGGTAWRCKYVCQSTAALYSTTTYSALMLG